MITYRPDYIVASRFGDSYPAKQPMDFLPLYEHLARKVLDWKLPFENLIDTSGRGFSEFEKIASQKDAKTTLAKLFLAVGTGYARGEFLHRLGIRRWADLAKPIVVPGRPCKTCYVGLVPHVRERRLVEPGPNEYHPCAIYGQSCYYQFSGWRQLWRFVLHYGYSHDSSTWTIHIEQGRSESLPTFVDETVPKWLSEKLVPENWAIPREQRNRDFEQLDPAVEAVFRWDSTKKGITTDLLRDILLDHRKPTLTGPRLSVLRRWIRDDAAADARRLRKQKEARGQ